MQEITSWNERALLRLFAGLEEHLAVAAVLHGAAAGRVWVDAPSAPRSAVLWVQHRVFVAGDSVVGLNEVVQEIAAAARARGDWGVGVYGADQIRWEGVLAGLAWNSIAREYWEIDREAWAPAAEKPMAGLTLRAADRELVTGAPLARIEQLREEMCSERPSVEDFLARSFGVCLVDEEKGALGGWCLSEYNCGDRCEVGIEVVEEYRRQGLGTLLARALCEEAFARRGLRRVGWHCLAANAASGATAQRAGLRLAKRYVGSLVMLAG